ncbi:hypothetical protein JXA32_15960 [Candidatus Sumerlaeota bacterium]|nr:hypothetical protein [Candidatus Sumerlaeota bacterium]
MLRRALLILIASLPCWTTGYAQTTTDLPVRKGLVLHLDAGDTDGRGNGDLGDSMVVQNWIDKSGQGNHAVSPTPLESPKKGRGVMGPNLLPGVVFDGRNDFMIFNKAIAGVRTAVMVVYEDDAVQFPQTYAPLICNSARIIMHRGYRDSRYIEGAQYLSEGVPHKVRMNGKVIDQTQTKLEKDAAIIIVSFTGEGATVDQLGRDRNFTDRVLHGGIGEYALYDILLTETDMKILEGYLSDKYGIPLSGNVRYTKIDLVNPGFEEPGTGKIWHGFDDNPDVPGWSSKQWKNSGIEFGHHVERTGTSAAYLWAAEKASCYQITNHGIHDGEMYRLSFWANNAPNLKVELIGWTETREVPLAEAVFNHNSKDYMNYSLDCTVKPDLMAAGMWLGIRFTDINTPPPGQNTWAYIDDVELGYARPADVETNPLHQSVSWLYSFEDAKRKANAEKKKILAVFIRQNDLASTELDVRVLNSKDFQLRSAGYVTVKLDVDANVEMVEHYRIVVIPTVMIFDSRGHYLDGLSSINSERPDEQLYPLMDKMR